MSLGHRFADEGASSLDKLPLRISPGTDPVALAQAWKRTSDWLSKWERVDPTVARAMVKVLVALANTSGITWVITSDFRDSPSHKLGAAVDVAPRPPVWAKYAASRNMDPLLNGRADVLAHLQKAASSVTPPASRAITLFAEDDHVHAHIHRGSGIRGRLWPHRTHLSYGSSCCDQLYRDNPNAFKPRF